MNKIRVMMKIVLKKSKFQNLCVWELSRPKEKLFSATGTELIVDSGSYESDCLHLSNLNCVLGVNFMVS